MYLFCFIYYYLRIWKTQKFIAVRKFEVLSKTGKQRQQRKHWTVLPLYSSRQHCWCHKFHLIISHIVPWSKNKLFPHLALD